jgi:hypothetical protein
MLKRLIEREQGMAKAKTAPETMKTHSMTFGESGIALARGACLWCNWVN